jgi:hypothetical protein
MPRRAISLLLSVLAVASAGPLSDDPLHGSGNKVYPINGWSASSGSFTMSATVPGDVVTDLEVAGGYGDPLFHLNWKNTSYDQEWTYKATFDAPASKSSDVLLVFDSVKMAATISLNGHSLGTVADQVSYSSGVKHHILTVPLL